MANPKPLPDAAPDALQWRLLALLAIGNLVIGSSAFVITGMIDAIARDLGVSAPAAGQAMTAYALATATLAPLAVMASGQWRRKNALLLALLMFLLGNVVCATAHSLTQLLIGRALLGAGSMFTPLAAGIAVAAVGPARRGQALSLVFLGISLSYVTGVPLGAWIGLQHSWQTAVWLMAGATLLMGLLVAWRVPARVNAPGASFAGAAAVLRRGEVQTVLATTLLYFGAIFVMFSYAGPVLTALVPMPAEQLSLTLALFGLAGVVGTLLGGRLGDRLGALVALRWMLPGLALTMLLLPLTAGRFGWMLAVLLCWGVAGFALMAPQQSRLATLSPAQAPLLLSLNTSMLYFGMALGAAVGGAFVGTLGFARLPWVGAPLALAALVLLWRGRAAAVAAAAASSPSAPR